MSAANNIIREILGHIDSEPVGGLRKADILKRLGNVDQKYARQLLSNLLKEGQICKKKGGRFVRASAVARHVGLFKRNPKGFGFVTLDNGKEDIFIQFDKTLGAMSGDKVQVAINPKADPRGPSGEITHIIERGRQDFVGSLLETKHGWVVRPLRRDLPASLPLHQDGPKAKLENAKDGDWVLAAYMPRTDERSPLEVTISKTVPGGNSVTGILGAICKEYGIPRKYNALSEHNAGEIIPMELPREDCTNLDVFTIDPPDAKDFDDAVSVQPGENGTLTVGVHIADVACMVPHGSNLDKAARLRGFTTYLPGKTIGMLPDILSSDKCSLKEGVDRLAHSVFLSVDTTTGEVLSSRRTHTLIRSRHRLTYDMVDRVLEGEPPEEIDADLIKTLNTIAELTNKMRKWRAHFEKFLPFTQPEIKIICGGSPMKILGLSKKTQTPAGELIEELMLAANVAVAKEMKQRQIKGFHRNHGAPSPDQLQEVADMARNILGMKTVRLQFREDIVNFLKNIAKEPCGEVLGMALLRCMPRAEYSLENLGHFGLGKEIYCHFTSPIRRYTDLLTHQQLIAADLGKKQIRESTLVEIVNSCNALENNIDQAGFAASDRLKMTKIINDKKDSDTTPLQCSVVRITYNGISLFLHEYGLMGFMEFITMKGDWFFDASSKQALCDDTKLKIRPGDPLPAIISHVDTVRGELLLIPAFNLTSKKHNNLLRRKTKCCH